MMKFVIFFFTFSIDLYAISILQEWIGRSLFDQNKCQDITDPNVYEFRNQKKIARDSLKAHAQFFLMKNLILNISKAAQSTNLPQTQFENEVNRIVNKFCLPHLTLISVQNLKDIFKTSFLKQTSFSPTEHYSRSDFYQSLNVFSDICSWNPNAKEVSAFDFYLNDSILIKEVINDYVHSDNKAICEQNYCRVQNKQNFYKIYPKTIEKKQFINQLYGLYCFDMNFNFKKRLKNFKQNTLLAKKEDHRKPLLTLYAAIAKLPLPFVVDKNEKISNLVLKKVFYNESQRSREIINGKIQKIDVFDDIGIRYEVDDFVYDISKLHLSFDLYGDEFDRLVYSVDKLSWTFELYLPRKLVHEIISELEDAKDKTNALRSLKLKHYSMLERKIKKLSVEKIKAAKYVVKMKEKIMDALFANLQSFRGPKSEIIDSQNPELKIPIKISMGWEAIRKISKREKLDIQKK